MRPAPGSPPPRHRMSLCRVPRCARATRLPPIRRRRHPHRHSRPCGVASVGPAPPTCRAGSPPGPPSARFLPVQGRPVRPPREREAGWPRLAGSTCFAPGEANGRPQGTGCSPRSPSGHPPTRCRRARGGMPPRRAGRRAIRARLPVPAALKGQGRRPAVHLRRG